MGEIEHGMSEHARTFLDSRASWILFRDKFTHQGLWVLWKAWPRRSKFWRKRLTSRRFTSLRFFCSSLWNRFLMHAMDSVRVMLMNKSLLDFRSSSIKLQARCLGWLKLTFAHCWFTLPGKSPQHERFEQLNREPLFRVFCHRSVVSLVVLPSCFTVRWCQPILMITVGGLTNIFTIINLSFIILFHSGCAFVWTSVVRAEGITDDHAQAPAENSVVSHFQMSDPHCPKIASRDTQLENAKIWNKWMNEWMN